MYAPTQWAPAPIIQTQGRSGASPRAAIAVIMVVLLACGGIGYTWLAHRDALPSGTSAFVAGKGVVYSPEDHAYTAQFPTRPHRRQPVEHRRGRQPHDVHGTRRQRRLRDRRW
jgi:hypothetical protein